MTIEGGKPNAQGQGEEKSPEEIQAEIEKAREDLGETVGQLAEKADVKKQAKRKVTEAKAKAQAKKEQAAAKAAAAKEGATAKVKQATPASAQGGAEQADEFVQRAGREASRAARENPLATAATAGFAAGLTVGWMIGRR